MKVRKLIAVLFSLFLSASVATGQVLVRLFSDSSPLSAVFTVSSGRYDIYTYGHGRLSVRKGCPVIIVRYNERLVVKTINSTGLICDSVSFKGRAGEDSFSLRVNGPTSIRKTYSGDLSCFPDMATLVFINSSEIEKYIAGVVETEGGTTNSAEYFKTQAILVRTYLYRNLNKHITDG
jgi:hypothetical protein